MQPNKDKQSGELSARKRGIVKSMLSKVSGLRSSMRLSQRKTPDKSPSPQKNANLEKALKERMQHWGQKHNLPEWAQAKMAQSLITEDERRKKRAELQARKAQLLKQASLRHAIVIGVKAAEEAKKKAEEAKKLMPEMRKGDLALPYQLESLNLEKLMTSQSQGSSSSSSSTSPTNDKKPPATEIAQPASPVIPAAPPSSPTSKENAKETKQNEESFLAALTKISVVEVSKEEKKKTERPGEDEPVEKYIAYLDDNDLWEKESNENALYNWLISQSSPEDLKNKSEPSKAPHVQFEPTIKGKTFPRGQKVYEKEEASKDYESKIIG